MWITPQGELHFSPEKIAIEGSSSARASIYVIPVRRDPKVIWRRASAPSKPRFCHDQAEPRLHQIRCESLELQVSALRRASRVRGDANRSRRTSCSDKTFLLFTSAETREYADAESSFLPPALHDSGEFGSEFAGEVPLELKVTSRLLGRDQ